MLAACPVSASNTSALIHDDVSAGNHPANPQERARDRLSITLPTISICDAKDSKAMTGRLGESRKLIDNFTEWPYRPLVCRPAQGEGEI